jgi:protein-disulfide isomerase
VYGKDVRVVWKNFPLDMHKNAMGAHLAAVAAGKQGKFWEFHDKLFGNQQQLNLDAYKQYARELKLDVPRFEKDLADLTNKKQIDQDKAEAQALGLTGTPSFFVNGRFLNGAKPFEDFAKLINAELTRLGVAIPPGAPTS